MPPPPCLPPLCCQLFTPLLKELEAKRVQPERYPYGSTGPIGSFYLASKYGVKWGDNE